MFLKEVEQQVNGRVTRRVDSPHFSSHLKMWRAIAAERRFFVATVRRRGSRA
jgi:hypothetical protein